MKTEIKQEIKKILISDLHLWSENPRDPIDLEIGNLEIIKRIIKDKNKKWNISKFIKEMGTHYDLSELPTIVFKNNKYFVYDGNRRIAILKYLQNPKWSYAIEAKLFPSFEPENLKNLLEIPCNVCNEKTALINIERKHITNGTWGQLERDYFAHNFRGKEKSLFLKFEEATNLISEYPELNENIMKNNILTERKLKEIGFSFDKNNDLISVYDEKLAKDILNKLAELKINKIISSRGDRKYQIKQPLSNIPEFKGKIKEFNKKEIKLVNYKKENKEAIPIRKTKRQNNKKNILFGEENLSLIDSITNDLYRDISDLHLYYEKNRDKLSNTFPNLIRMALRLLIESAINKDDCIENYIKSNFSNAKTNLNQDKKTTLSNHSVNENSLISLLHTGAHNYSNSSNIEQTIAISIIIGEMLKITHKKEKKRKK
ncbi:hypothetical protein KAI04_02965 [Candidatus Pacearchaeota archaeon]|nr:hypothetical protein [Candidatus Pacearchaeota archaeon]